MATKDKRDRDELQALSDLNNELVTLQRQLVQQKAALEEQVKKNEILQKKVLSAERNKVLIQIAGAAAHQINQPLTVLFGNTQLLLMQKKEDTDLKEMLVDILEAAKDISVIVEQMQTVQEFNTVDYVDETKIADFGYASDKLLERDLTEQR